MTLPSNGKYYNDDEEYAEGEFGYLYDDEEVQWVESDVSENEDGVDLDGFSK